MIIKENYAKLRNGFLRIQYNYSKRIRKKYNIELRIQDIKNQYQSLNSKYIYFHHFFWNLAPLWLKDHREYFSKEQRAFGEDALHAMWYHVFKEFAPRNILEIGIYRGSTLSLFTLLAQKFKFRTEVHGISPFTSVGDTVSKYLDNIDYYADVEKNFIFFNLPIPYLHKGFSTDKAMVDIIQSKIWDLIFIDGNHDYEVVKHDFNVCSKNLCKGGLIVLDDASLYADYKPPFYSSKGHPGPSKVANEIDLNLFEEILSVGHNRVFKKL